jgi:hypothetical protein
VEAQESPNGEVAVRLSKAEALVLFEWIHREEDRDTALAHLALVDDAERRVLWDLSGSLEAVLAEPFLPEYKEILEAARARVRGSAA